MSTLIFEDCGSVVLAAGAFHFLQSGIRYVAVPLFHRVYFQKKPPGTTDCPWTVRGQVSLEKLADPLRLTRGGSQLTIETYGETIVYLADRPGPQTMTHLILIAHDSSKIRVLGNWINSVKIHCVITGTDDCLISFD